MNRAAALLSLVLLPLAWLWPCAFGARQFVPYDLAQFPPASITCSDAELAAARAGANFDVTEVPVWFLPELEFARDELRRGRLPLWNPHARTGAPLHAHGLIGLGYPPNWLALFADDPGARLWLVAWANLAIAGLLALGLFRQLGCGWLAAWLGAALFELSGPMAANAFFWMRLASFVWLPGVLWLMLRIAAAERLHPLPLLALALTFAMAWLGGFPPFAATTTVFAGLTFAWLCGERWRQNGARPALRLAAALAAGLGFGACLALPQVLPSLAFFPHSARPPVPEWRDVAGQAFEPYGLCGYLLPDAFGHPTALGELPYKQGPLQLSWNTRQNLDGTPALPNYNFTEYTVTVSGFGLGLALLGLLAWSGWTGGRGRRVWLMRTALLLGLGLGLFAPGLQWLFHLPVVQNVWPMRWPAATTLFVCWAAALGAERLLAAGRRLPLGLGAATLLGAAITLIATRFTPEREAAIDRLATHYRCDAQAVVNHVQDGAAPGVDRFAVAAERLRESGAAAALWLAIAGAGWLAFGFVRDPRRRPAVLLAGGAIGIVQLALFGGSITHGAERQVSLDSPVHGFLRERADAMAEAGGFTIVRAATAPGLPDQLPPGELLHRGIRDLNFYSHADRFTLQTVQRLLGRYAERLGLAPDIGERIAGKGYLTQSLPAALLPHPLFDLLGVRYALTTERLDAPLGQPVGPELRGRGTLFVHERPSALPRAWTVPQVLTFVDDDRLLEALCAADLAPRQRAFALAADVPRELDAGSLASAPADTPARTVRFVRDDATGIELDVEAGAAPWLVLADTFLPGWSATVDGRPTALVRANHSQRLCALPPTACRVVFRYRAPGLLPGLALAAFATLGFVVWSWRTRHRHTAAR